MNTKHHNTWRKQLQHLLQRAFNFSCLLCYQPSATIVCHWCENDLFFFDNTTYDENLLYCGLVSRHVKHCHYDALSVLGIYTESVAHLIQKLKFSHSLAAGRILANWFYTKRIHSSEQLPQVLLPVPIHPTRLFSRHYNQATVLADDIGTLADIPVEQHWAIRTGRKTQHHLGRTERATNAKSAFSLSARCLDKRIATSNITCVAIVDDIITTGVTVNHLAQQLRKRYPQLTIHVWAIAFTPPPKSALLNE